MATLIMIALMSDFLATLLGLVLLWAYCVGNAWYRSRVGRALVTMTVCVELILVVNPLGYFLSWPVWTGLVPYFLVTVAMAVMAFTFTRERARVRRERSWPEVDRRSAP
jgi:4-amino-4-deoxy-L-arabinose transferase-like glycosyltransferase